MRREGDLLCLGFGCFGKPRAGSGTLRKSEESGKGPRDQPAAAEELTAFQDGEGWGRVLGERACLGRKVRANPAPIAGPQKR